MPITRVSDAILIVREMVKQNWSPMGIISPGSPGPYEKAFTDALGKYGDGYMSCVPWYDPTNKRAREIAQRFENEMDARFDLNAAFAFEAVEIAADALKRAKSHEPADIHAALKTTNITDHIILSAVRSSSTKRARITISAASCCRTRTASRWWSSPRARAKPSRYSRSCLSTKGDRRRETDLAAPT